MYTIICYISRQKTFKRVYGTIDMSIYMYVCTWHWYIFLGLWLKSEYGVSCAMALSIAPLSSSMWLVHWQNKHTNTHTHAHTRTQCAHTHIHTCAHTHMRTYTHAHIHTCTHTHMHTYTHAHMHTYTCAHTHIHIHTCAYTHTYMRTYTHVHIHTYTHVHSAALARNMCTLTFSMTSSGTTAMFM